MKTVPIRLNKLWQYPKTDERGSMTFTWAEWLLGFVLPLGIVLLLGWLFLGLGFWALAIGYGAFLFVSVFFILFWAWVSERREMDNQPFYDKLALPVLPFECDVEVEGIDSSVMDSLLVQIDGVLTSLNRREINDYLAQHPKVANTLRQKYGVHYRFSETTGWLITTLSLVSVSPAAPGE
jgi:hypothetical protein